MKNIWTVALLSFKDGLRYRILYGVLIAAILLMAFAVLISGLFMRDILKIMVDICLSAVSLGGLLVPFFLAINLLSMDIEQKTIYTIIARPVSRTHYILGKYLGLSLLTASIMAILTAATLLAIWMATFTFAPHFFSTFSLTAILTSCATSLAGVLVLLSTVVLWSTLTTSSFLATLLTIATYVIGQTAEDIVRFMLLKNTGVEISPTIQTIVWTSLHIFPNLKAFDFKQYAAYGLNIPAQEVGLLCLYAGTYIITILSITSLIFSRRDLP